MESIAASHRKEIWHGDYNLDKKDNLAELPREEAVFGIFAIVNDEPVNCRFIGFAGDLQESVRSLYDHPPGEGLKKFMQGPWIQMLVYEPMAAASEDQKKAAVTQWTGRYLPGVDEDGGYPGYYGVKKEA